MTQTRLLFVHGAAGDARIWEPVISAMPEGWQAEAITLTYFGTAPWPDDGGGFGTPLHAAELCDQAERMGGNVRIICWSYAVHVGLLALLHRPGLFSGAMFYEAGLPNYLSDPAELEFFRRDFKSCFGPVSAALKNEGEEAAVRALIGPAFDRMPEHRQAIYIANASMMPLLMGGGQAPAKIGVPELSAIDTPCRVAMGSDTRPAFALSSRALAHALPKGDLHEVADADHFLPETDPIKFAEIVIDWVSG